jgi:hypothetical protein
VNSSRRRAVADDSGSETDEELDLLRELLEPGDRPHLVLHGRHPHRPRRRRGVRRGVLRVQPLHVDRVAGRLDVLRQVVLEHLADREAVRELRGQRGILELLADDPLDVLLGRHLVGDLGVAGDPPGDQDRAQVAPHRELAARLVQAARQPLAAVLGIDDDVDPVQGVALGVVVADVAVVRDVLERVVGAEVLLVDDQRARGGDQDAVVFDAELALREHRELALHLLGRPRLDVRERLPLQRLDRLDVALLQRPEDQPGARGLCHRPSLPSQGPCGGSSRPPSATRRAPSRGAERSEAWGPRVGEARQIVARRSSPAPALPTRHGREQNAAAEAATIAAITQSDLPDLSLRATDACVMNRPRGQPRTTWEPACHD